MTTRLADLHRSLARHPRAEGKSERTVVIYGRSIDFFSRWLEAEGRAPSLDELNRAVVREWLAQLADTHEASTVNTRYRVLFRSCRWLVDEDELPENLMRTLAPPQPTSKPVSVLTDEELAALMKVCSGKEFRDRRDEAMIRLLLDCGLRVHELCALAVAVDGVDLDQGMAIVRGKGNRVRLAFQRRHTSTQRSDVTYPCSRPRPMETRIDTRSQPTGCEPKRPVSDCNNSDGPFGPREVARVNHGWSEGRASD